MTVTGVHVSIEESATRAAIVEVLHRYARGMDRMDKPLTLSCWHPDGTDDHAPLFRGTAAGFLEWLWPVHAAMDFTRHSISNWTIAVKGDQAVCESSWATVFRQRDADGRAWDTFGYGRYLDRFERISSRWAIRHRRAVRDFSRIDPVAFEREDPRAPVTITPHNPEATAAVSRRDRADASYELFCTLEGDE